MPYNYMIPTVGILPRGYDCTVDPILHAVGRFCVPGRVSVVWRIRVFHEAREIDCREWTVEFVDGEPVGTLPEPFVWPRGKSDWNEDIGFFECEFVTGDGSLGFKNSLQPGTYVLFSAPGRKCTLATRNYKFASPPTIDQIAAYSRFVDAYPAIRIDRPRDYGESIVMINPYRRDIIARIVSHDERALDRIRVPARSARLVRLEALLHEGEAVWQGRIQISATNRLITGSLKHSLAEPDIITDEEHLDPYRADPTHLPAFQYLRQAIGRKLMLLGKQA